MAKDNSLKTGKLPREFKKKWVDALRSGEYEQGRGKLHFHGKFCCLGVAELVAGDTVETIDDIGLPYYLINPKTPNLLSNDDSCDSVSRTLASLNDNEIPFEVIAGFIQENL